MAAVEQAITGLVARLEAVAKRLESVEGQLASGAGAASTAVQAGAGDDAGESSASVRAYDELVASHINALVEHAKSIGDAEVIAASEGVLRACQAQSAFLAIAAKSKKPATDVLQKLLEPTSKEITEATALFERNRGHKWTNHLQGIAEGIPGLGWVAVEPTPGPFVGDMRGGSEFYTNRILKEFKDKDETQVNWVKAFNGFLRELQAYIKQYHTTGVVWNPNGGDAADFVGAAPSAAAPAGGPPPPPGPAPPPPAPEVSSGGATAGADMSSVFASLNKGEAVTSGLRKVTRDMTNKDKKISGAVVAKASSAAPKKAAAAAAPAKPPKFGLAGTKWEVEFQDGNRSLVIEETEIRQTVYIYRCKNSTIQIKNKVNAIIIDSCERCAVVFDNAVASVDIVNCKSIETQVTGTVPSFSIDKCSSILLHLSKEAKSAEIVTSKCDSVNIAYPVEGKEDPIEQPVPEQFKTLIRDDSLVTETIRHE